MRDFKGMKRQRNRGRGSGGGGGGGKPQHNANRAFDSNGPDGVKVRGAAQHIFEKYQQLARDAGSAGDRVLAENYLQHAEHYFRVLRAMQPQRPLAEIMGRDQFASGYDIDFEEEPQPEGADSAEGDNDEGRRDERQQQGGDRPWARDDRQRDDRQRDDRQRDDRPREDRQQGEYRQQGDFRQRDGYRQRDDRPRDERPRDDRQQGDFRPREDRQQGEFRQREDRDQGGRDDRYRDERQGRFSRDDARGERQSRFQGRPEREPRADRDAPRDPLTVVEPQAAAPLAPTPAYQPPEEPRGGMLRGEDGTVSQAPAFLQARAAEPTEEPAAETRRPRRRRAPRTFEAGETAPAEADEG
jgi:hypothetical protein